MKKPENENKRKVASREVTVGIDLSDKTSTVCVLDSKSGKVVARQTIATNAIDYDRLFEKYSGQTVGIETSINDQWIIEIAQKHGINLNIGDPVKLQPFLSAYSVNKSDRKDADGIAELLRTSVKLFSPIVKRDTRYVELGRLVAAREFFMRSSRAGIIKIRTLSKAYGIRYNVRVSSEFGAYVRSFLKTSKAPASLVSIITPITRLVDSSYRKELTIANRLRRYITTKFPVECANLKTIPGVGDKTICVFIAYTGDINRFKSNRTVAAYFGLTPTSCQSGRKDLHFGITKHGNVAVRTALVNSARCILANDADTALRRFGQKIIGPSVDSHSYGRALVSVARKLAVSMASILRHPEPYRGVFSYDNDTERRKMISDIKSALKRNDYSIKETAKDLGVSRAYLVYRLKIYDLYSLVREGRPKTVGKRRSHANHS